MRTAFEYYGVRVAEVDKVILREIKEWLDQLPDLGPGVEGLLSCHVVARLVKFKFRLTTWTVVDGHFGRSQHSWLVFDTTAVMDTYPVASMGGPLLVDISRLSPWASLYIPDQKGEWFSAKDRARFDGQAERFLEML